MKKILLDENLPRPLAKLLSISLEVISVHDIGWAEKKNGDLIRSMLEEGFVFLLTADKNLQNQQIMPPLNIGAGSPLTFCTTPPQRYQIPEPSEFELKNKNRCF